MALDPFLELFARRLTSDDEPCEVNETHELYREVLERVCYKFNSEVPLPFEDRVQKAYPGFIQLHYPARDLEEMCKLGMGWHPEEWARLYPAESKLGEWLIEHSSEIADQFIKGTREKNIDTLYCLELLQGVRGALFLAPFRLIWDYWIAEDCYIARFDLIGHVRES